MILAESLDKTLGKMIRDTRIEKEITQRGLAKLTKISPAYLNDIEHDNRIPAEEKLCKIARVLNLDIGDLLARAGRLGDDAERYLRQHPTAGILFRRIAAANLGDDDLRKLITICEQIEYKRSLEWSTL